MGNESRTSPLLTSYKMGKFNLSHRVVLPPLTRNRAFNNKPEAHVVEYYAQRATNGGFLISEAVAATDISLRCPNMPGIWTEKQAESWKPVVEAVHAKGGIIFCQIWHPARISNISIAPEGSDLLETGFNKKVGGDYHSFDTTSRGSHTTAEEVQSNILLLDREDGAKIDDYILLDREDDGSLTDGSVAPQPYILFDREDAMPSSLGGNGEDRKDIETNVKPSNGESFLWADRSEQHPVPLLIADRSEPLQVSLLIADRSEPHPVRLLFADRSEAQPVPLLFVDRSEPHHVPLLFADRSEPHPVPLLFADRSEPHPVPVLFADRSERHPVPLLFADRSEPHPVPLLFADRSESHPVPLLLADRSEPHPVPLLFADRSEAHPVPLPFADRSESHHVPLLFADRSESNLVPLLIADRSDSHPVPLLIADRISATTTNDKDLQLIHKGDISDKLSIEQSTSIINDFVLAARRAIKAGFDGVEINCAHGYLIERELKMKLKNKRGDDYGGSIEKRCRLALDVVEAVAKEIGRDRVGIKLSPFDDFQGSGNLSPEAAGTYLATELNQLGLLYLHVTEPRMIKIGDTFKTPRSLQPIREAFEGTLIASGGYGKLDGDEAVAQDYADLVSFGRLFLANPDLPKRFQLNAPLNKHDRSTFYTPVPTLGYTDYPSLHLV